MKLAIIPARGGSKRIKNKNIINFLGKPLIAYSLNVATESGLFDKIHVSTDSEDIRTIVEKLGYKVDFMRSSELADDHTGLVPVLKWVHEQYKNKGEFFEEVCCIFPTAPLLQSKDLIEAFDLFHKNNNKNPLLVVAPYPVPVEWAFYRDENTFLTPRDPNSLTIRSQDIKNAFYESGPFTIWNSSHLQSENPFKQEQFISFQIDKAQAVDIDDPEDMELAKALFLGRLSLKKLSENQ